MKPSLPASFERTAMAPTGDPLPLDYTAQWVSLGIVSAADISRDERESLTSDDSHAEHYRWRAFSRFFAGQSQLTPSLAQQLYALGAAETDSAMGGSIMAAVLLHPDCPGDMLQAGRISERSHLRRIAAQRLNPNDRNA